ncbi:sodium bile acid symporter family-domain-containing protein [Zopfochytrium polystomum]|nr:sodium bile acid symporter family-domain-containing protein [Zopfochytrium polystomum]
MATAESAHPLNARVTGSNGPCLTQSSEPKLADGGSSNDTVHEANNDHADVIPRGHRSIPDESNSAPRMSLFHKFLSVWILLAILLGVLLGRLLPAIPDALDKATLAQVSIPIAVLLWGMILPMMLQIDFASVKNVLTSPWPVVMTSVVNYAVQPFTMYGFGILFLKVAFGGYFGEEKAKNYLIGTILLGGAPCTAMVFVWSRLMNGNAAYTLTQVAVNDILLLVIYSPVVELLAGTSNISIPWDTLFLSVGFFIVVPLLVAIALRASLIAACGRARGLSLLTGTLIPLLDTLSMFFLVLTVALLFISQAPTIASNWLDMLAIAVPLTVQTFAIWALTYLLALLVFRLPYEIAGPATLIACSNFFEWRWHWLSRFVGVLIEVPVMLVLVWINNQTKHVFPKAERESEVVLDRNEVSEIVEDVEKVAEEDVYLQSR